MPHKSNLAEASQCIPYKLKAGCRWQMTSLRFNNAVSIGHIQHTLQPLTLAVMITCTFHAGGRVHVHVTIILSCFCKKKNAFQVGLVIIVKQKWIWKAIGAS